MKTEVFEYIERKHNKVVQIGTFIKLTNLKDAKIGDTVIFPPSIGFAGKLDASTLRIIAYKVLGYHKPFHLIISKRGGATAFDLGYKLLT